jgi:methanogenic corrinoid protein MtbC1
VQKYQIKDLELISGIKAHTIRIWEQRYKIFTPERSATNIRFYSDEDLKKLLCIVVLLNCGSKISEFKNLTNSEIYVKVKLLVNFDAVFENLLVAMLNFDQRFFNKLIDDYTKKNGFDTTIQDVIYPLFNKIGLLWQTSAISPSHEHFISNMLRQKFAAQIDNLPLPKKYKKTFLLFLPFYEQHEIGLLYAHYIAKKHGHNVVYLGQNVPTEDVLKAAAVIKPDVVISFFVSQVDTAMIIDMLTEFHANLANTTILVSGPQVVGKVISKWSNLKIISSPVELKNYL